MTRKTITIHIPIIEPESSADMEAAAIKHATEREGRALDNVSVEWGKLEPGGPVWLGRRELLVSFDAPEAA